MHVRPVGTYWALGLDTVKDNPSPENPTLHLQLPEIPGDSSRREGLKGLMVNLFAYEELLHFGGVEGDGWGSK